ncbi:hypothetical protein BD410DRAFT_899171 [Rickenella mellea]|uniref:Uncharacterized protein n=1 Tax=Rickenella mellea TaxID=50990 RepID=A0A4Y7PZQ6_9AGAM|nr:hypothetical protein BD410DRAFT_899171 [Rickenella mellea]
MFRASPWISYDPSESTPHTEMDVDVDMDAPQISTLREDESPPPAQARVSKFRVKLRVTEPGTQTSSSPSKPHPETEEDEDELDDEEEEDQLADDDDLPQSTAPTPPLVTTPLRGAAAAKVRGQGKGRGRARGRGKGAPEPGPMMTWFEVSPSSVQDGHSSPPKGAEPSVSAQASASATPTGKPPRKRPARKNPNPSKPGRKSGPKASKLLLQDLDDIGTVSEAFGGTAPSSPLMRDVHTPEYDSISADPHLPLMDDQNMDAVPMPIYPLPAKPFFVQPLPKFPTGFAPSLPLDKTSAKVRHWRQAHREIRGIAGGRWFTKTWVGEKDSEFAIASSAASALALQNQQAAAAEKGKEKEKPSSAAGTPGPVTLPKLPGGAMAISAGTKKAAKSKLAKTDGGSTAASSRSASVVPDIHIVRPPQVSKMRNIVAGPDDSNEVDNVATPLS